MADIGCYSLSEGFDFTIPPFLKDINFWFWKARMTSFIKAFDFDMWDVFTRSFDFKPRSDWNENEKKMFSLNIRAMKILYSAVTENDFKKIRLCSSAKDIWDTLNSLYASNDCVQVESNDSSSESMSCMSSVDEQKEKEVEEEVTEHFLGSIKLKENEKEDSQDDLTMDEFDESCSEAQNACMVNNSNSSCAIWKINFDSLHKTVFQPNIDYILKSKTILNHAGNIVGKKESSSMHVPNQHNICKSAYYKHHSVICNYCGKSGHMSHTCFIRRNYNVRNKFVWVLKGQDRSNTNIQGPKVKWVPKCPSSSILQNTIIRHGHKGTGKKKKKPRVLHAPKKRFYESLSKRRTHRKAIASTLLSEQKKQWIQSRSTSTIDYHKVPFNYPEENKKRRISQASSRRHMKPISHERLLHVPKAKYAKTTYNKNMHWVSKANPPCT